MLGGVLGLQRDLFQRTCYLQMQASLENKGTGAEKTPTTQHGRHVYHAPALQAWTSFCLAGYARS